MGETGIVYGYRGHHSDAILGGAFAGAIIGSVGASFGSACWWGFCIFFLGPIGGFIGGIIGGVIGGAISRGLILRRADSSGQVSAGIGCFGWFVIGWLGAAVGFFSPWIIFIIVEKLS